MCGPSSGLQKKGRGRDEWRCVNQSHMMVSFLSLLGKNWVRQAEKGSAEVCVPSHLIQFGRRGVGGGRKIE